ncbi:hypothetical protein ACQP2F_13000 [Actinoplanes sp. CA-030573]|uniref:hypothetical protein n=1 Tax=Actinoplanes sp. CA-030573 TaxID=3239898 RepID=UPI003D8CA10B
MTTFPVTADIQFAPASGTLYVDDLVDPSGTPTTVLDIDQGFKVKGRVELPGWLSGKGLVRITADEKGGPIDTSVGEQLLTITGSTSPTDPPAISYPFEIEVKSPALPDESKMYDLGVIFVFQTAAGGHTDIGGFYDLGAFLVV